MSSPYKARPSTVTPVLTVHATYVANDYVGTSATAMIFTECAAEDGGGTWIQSAELIDLALQSVLGELWIFDTAVTPPADSAAWSLSDADIAHCKAVLPFSTYFASALNSVSFYEGNPKFVKCAAGSRSLYGCYVTRGAPAYASGDLTFVLGLMPG